MTIEEIENLIIERDYYKKMYLECNNPFIEGKLGRDNTCLHCGEGKPDYCEKCYQELIARDLKRQNKD